jgi:hypothetical protein
LLLLLVVGVVMVFVDVVNDCDGGVLVCFDFGCLILVVG